MNITIITCAREPAYLDATLDSLFAADPTVEKVHLLIHEPTVECAARWISDPRVNWRKLLPEEVEAKNRLGRRTRVAHAMRLALEDAGDEDCVFLEDDAVFEMDWLVRFQGELDEAFPGDARNNKMILIRSHLRFQKDGMLRLDPKSYYGTVAVYFGAQARKTAIDALAAWERRPMPNPGMGSDLCLKQMLLTKKNIELFTRFPNLVEHTGKVSSIGSTSPQKKKLAFEARKAHPPVAWPEKTSRPTAPTPSTVQSPQAVTTKQRKNPNPPVAWGKKAGQS